MFLSTSRYITVFNIYTVDGLTVNSQVLPEKGFSDQARPAFLVFGVLASMSPRCLGAALNSRVTHKERRRAESAALTRL